MASLKQTSYDIADALEGFEAPDGLAPVAVYADFKTAGEAGLAILAMGHPYWTFQHEERFVICVGERWAAPVMRELDAVASLQLRRRVREPAAHAEAKVGVSSFAVYGLLLVTCFAWQGANPKIEIAGRVDAIAMIGSGEVWRAVTALTLHGDVVHLVANLVSGAGFAFFVARLFGPAVGWALILLSGLLGNLVNAALYYPEPHLSIGASTAVFGALGLMTGAGVWIALRSSANQWMLPRWFVPALGGLTLLGLLGAGEGLIDVSAHVTGFAAGGLLGFSASAVREKRGLVPDSMWPGFAVLALVVASWAVALVPT